MFTAPAGMGVWDSEAEFVANFNAEMNACGIKAFYRSAAEIAEKASKPVSTAIGGQAELPRGNGGGAQMITINSGSEDGVTPAESATPVVRRERAATPGQTEWLIKMDGKKAERADVDAITAKAVAGEFVTFAEAKTALDYLFDKSVAYRQSKPVKAAESKSERVTEDGYYLHNGTYYKVQIAKNGSGNLYAKVFDADSKTWEYTPGAIRDLSASEKLSKEAACEFGHLYGQCIKCSRPLTKETSIARGMGDKCAGSW